MRKYIVFTALVTFVIFTFLLSQISTASAQSNTFVCIWRPDIDPAACVAAADCAEGFAPSDVCNNRPMESCYEEGIPCEKAQGGTGWKCVNHTCESCDMSQPGCYPLTESECGLYCYTGGGFTYNCNEPDWGCIPVQGGSGRYLTLGDCQASCHATYNDPKICTTSEGATGISTAIGCIIITRGIDFITTQATIWAFGIGSALTLLMLVLAGFLTMTSMGNPQRLQSAKDLAGAAISGLVLLIFSVLALRLLGANILGLF